ncbi:restriction endonuclease subunit S [Methanobacterium formicicum]|uniref:restriction endonuclease subunit S n=1 Tax=Methanobacterium formicicum TaxID=2162 RepID=UPI0009DEA302
MGQPQLLTTSSVRKEITSRSGGSTRYNIGQESLKTVKINIPSIQEQKKIASFLSQIDRKIVLLETNFC